METKTQQHTPEPWSNSPLAKPNIIISEADWKRAVACVNACVGMTYPEEVIKAMRAVKVDDLSAENIGMLKIERDHLQKQINEHPKSELTELRYSLEMSQKENALLKSTIEEYDKDLYKQIGVKRIDELKKQINDAVVLVAELKAQKAKLAEANKELLEALKLILDGNNAPDWKKEICFNLIKKHSNA